VAVTSQCGWCYNCLHGKADRQARAGELALRPTQADGTAVNGNLGASPS
jgi:hypothetical protein